MLNYKAANIANAEEKRGLNFFKTLEGFGESSPSLTQILFVLEAGGLSREEAGNMVDEKGLVDSIQLAVKKLGEAGFLANAQAETENPSKETSQTSGETAKA